jgi:hypothetical protein
VKKESLQIRTAMMKAFFVSVKDKTRRYQSKVEKKKIGLIENYSGKNAINGGDNGSGPIQGVC